MKKLFSLVLIVVLTSSVFAEWDQIDFGKGSDPCNVQAGFTNWDCQGDVDGSSRTRSTSWDSSFTYVINGDYNAPDGATTAGAGNPWLEGRDIGDGGSALAASLCSPTTLGLDKNNNLLYLLDILLYYP